MKNYMVYKLGIFIFFRGNSRLDMYDLFWDDWAQFMKH